MEISVQEVREQIVKLRASKEFKHLSDYYNKKSFFNIIGVARKENTHSDFLSWLLNPNESHKMDDFALRRLLELTVIAKNKFQSDLLWDAQELETSIINNAYELDSVVCNREYSIKNENSSGRLDIYASFDIRPKIEGQEYSRFDIILENKVNSKEHGDQTTVYYNWGKNQKKGNTIYLFLSTLPSSDSPDQEIAKCASEYFIKINYQDLLDYVLEPCLLECNDDASRIFIKEYLRTLSQPSLEFTDDAKDIGIMAVSSVETKLLKDFWEKNESILERTIEVLTGETSGSESLEKKDLFEGFIGSNKDLLLAVFNVLLKNEENPRIRNASTALSATKRVFTFEENEYKVQSRLVLAVLRSYAAGNPSRSIKDVNDAFGLAGIREIQSTSYLEEQTEDRKKRYFMKDEERLKLAGEECAVSTQWTWSDIEAFLEKAKIQNCEIGVIQPRD